MNTIAPAVLSRHRVTKRPITPNLSAMPIQFGKVGTNDTLQIAPSATFAAKELAGQLANSGQTVHDCTVGQPNIPAPQSFLDAVVKRVNHAFKFSKYAAANGQPELRSQVANFVSQTYGTPIDPDQVLITHGSKQGLADLFRAVDGDILIPDIAWVSYEEQIKLAGKPILPVPTEFTNGHFPTPEALEETYHHAKEFGKNPQVLLLNTINNPTGAMPNQAKVDALVAKAKELDLGIISDQAYELLVTHPPNIVAQHPEETIITSSLTKGFARQGDSIGWVITPNTDGGKALYKKMKQLSSQDTVSGAVPIQRLATEWFDNPENKAHQAIVRRFYAARTQAFYNVLAKDGTDTPSLAENTIQPAAPYIWLDFSPQRAQLQAKGITNSDELMSHLGKQYGIVGVPGGKFVPGGSQAVDPPLTLRLSLFQLDLGSNKEADERFTAFSQAATEGKEADDGALITPDTSPELFKVAQTLRQFKKDLG